MKAIDMADALASIGYPLDDIPYHRITDGCITISVASDDEDESEETLAELRRNLPAGATAEWSGNSETDGDGYTTSDIEITWDT